MVKPWYDRYIDPGSDFKSEIGKKFKSADIILLMISCDFIDSEFCCHTEMKIALSRADKGDAIVIPVILRPCRWINLPVDKRLAVPKDGKAVIEYEITDKAYLEVVIAVEEAAKKLLKENNTTKNADQKTTPLINSEVASIAELGASPSLQSKHIGNRSGVLAGNNDSIAAGQKTLIKNWKEKT